MILKPSFLVVFETSLFSQNLKVWIFTLFGIPIFYVFFLTFYFIFNKFFYIFNQYLLKSYRKWNVQIVPSHINMLYTPIYISVTKWHVFQVVTLFKTLSPAFSIISRRPNFQDLTPLPPICAPLPLFLDIKNVTFLSFFSVHMESPFYYFFY